MEEEEVATCLDGVRLVENFPVWAIVMESDCAPIVAKLQAVEPDGSMMSSLV